MDWDFPITVRGLAEMGRYSVLGAWKPFGARDHAMVEEAIHVAELGAFANRQIKALSGGQQQRAFLARAWAQEAGIYLLDEPFSGLDKTRQPLSPRPFIGLGTRKSWSSSLTTTSPMPANSSTTSLSSTANWSRSARPRKP